MGVLVVSRDQRILFQDLVKLGMDRLSEKDMKIPFLLLNDIEEVDLFFEHYRLYVRKCPVGLLWVIMQPDAAAALVRLQCDIVVPKMSLIKKPPKKRGRLFKY